MSSPDSLAFEHRGRWIEAHAVPVTGGGGQIDYAMLLLEDATGRRIVADRMSTTEARLNALVNSASDAVWSVDLERRIVMFNPTFARDFKDAFGAELKSGMTLATILPAQLVPVWRELYDRAFAGETVTAQHTYPVRGRTEHFIVTVSPIVSDDLIVGAAVFSKNITQRAVAETALRASEVRYRSIVETAAEGIWQTGATLETQFVNPRIAEVLGYAVDELQKASIIDFVDPAHQAPLRELLIRREGPIVRRDTVFRHRDGREVWMLVSTRPIEDNAGAIGALTMLADITSRHRAEVDQARLAAIVESSGDAMFTTDANGCVENWNAAAQTITGFTLAEVIGKQFTLLVGTERVEWSRAMFERVISGAEIEPYETTWVRKDGSPANVLVGLTRITASGRVNGVAVSAKDLRQNK